MSKTVVGLFPSTAAAQNVRQQFLSSGYSADDLRIVANDHDDHYGAGEGSGIGEKVSHFFKSLTGGDDDAHNHYANGVNQGGALLTVKTDDDRAQEAATLLRQQGARDIEGDVAGGGYDGTSRTGTSSTGKGDTGAAPAYAGRNADYREGKQTDSDYLPGTGSTTGTGTTGYADDATGTGTTRGLDADDTSRGRGTDTDEQAIPVVEENLIVGKREVDRGGVRVYSHVVETPVSTDVNLRDENIRVERRPVDRAATADDFASGRSYEVRATGEEAVVGKTARVVEEVLVGKETTQHTEAIHDSVRRTEVEVEEIPGSETSTTSDAGTRSNTGKGY